MKKRGSGHLLLPAPKSTKNEAFGGCVWANISFISRTQIVFLLLGNKPSLSLLALPKLLELDSLKGSELDSLKGSGNSRRAA